MTLREYYLHMRSLERPPHPAKAFLLRVSQETGRSPRTVAQWFSLQQVPPADLHPLLSELTGIPVSELFADFALPTMNVEDEMDIMTPRASTIPSGLALE